MNHEFKLIEYFNESCGNGIFAVQFLVDTIRPYMEDNPESTIILDFANIKRMNSSFANALFGNFYVLYGDERLKIKNLKPDLAVLIIAGLEYGMRLKNQEKDAISKDSWLKRMIEKIKESI